MRRLPLPAMCVVLACSLARGEPDGPARAAWRAVVAAASQAQVFQLNPAAYGEWVTDKEPDDALESIVSCLREGDGVHSSNPVLEQSMEHARALAGLRSDGSQCPTRDFEPTLGLIFEHGRERVALLVDIERRCVWPITAAGRSPAPLALALSARELDVMVSDITLAGLDHSEVLAAPLRLRADLRAALEEANDLTIHALHDADWDAAFQKAAAPALAPFDAARAALQDPTLVKGSVALQRSRVRIRIGSDLAHGLEAPQPLRVLCWAPAHAVHLRRGTFESIVVLCYGCSKALVYVRGERDLPRLQPFGSRPYVFDHVLRMHGIEPPLPLPERIQARQRPAPPAEAPAPR